MSLFQHVQQVGTRWSSLHAEVCKHMKLRHAVICIRGHPDLFTACAHMPHKLRYKKAHSSAHCAPLCCSLGPISTQTNDIFSTLQEQGRNGQNIMIYNLCTVGRNVTTVVKSATQIHIIVQQKGKGGL